MNRLGISILLMAHILLIPLSCFAGDRAVLLPETTKYCTTPLSIPFNIGRDNIRGAYMGLIDQIGLLMQKSPSATAIIEGHADDEHFSQRRYAEIVSYLKNLELSQKRAEGVINYLAKKFSIDRSRFAAQWYGDTRPETKAGTLAERAENRRVIVILNCGTK